jgi:hypothetical protein
MVVVLLRVHPLVARGVAADLNPLHQVEPLQLIQSSVHARPPNRVEAAVDLEGGDRAALLGERLYYLASRGSGSMPRLAEALHRSFGPAHEPDAIR